MNLICLCCYIHYSPPAPIPIPIRHAILCHLWSFATKMTFRTTYSRLLAHTDIFQSNAQIRLNCKSHWLSLWWTSSLFDQKKKTTLVLYQYYIIHIYTIYIISLKSLKWHEEDKQNKQQQQQQQKKNHNNKLYYRF